MGDHHATEGTEVISLSWLLLIGIIGGALALVDGATRTRGRGVAVLGVIEIVVAALFVLSLFIPAIPFGALTLAIVTLVVLIVQLVLGRRGAAVTVVALILIAAWIVLSIRWIVIPGIG
jgi:hypothetical protein